MSSAQQRQAEARRLKRLREVMGLTQRELAQEFKAAHGAIAAWESGMRTIPGPVSKLIELYEEELGLVDSADTSRGVETSASARTLALGRIAGSVVVRAVGGSLTRWLTTPNHANALSTRANAALARNVADALGELKGLAMKVGQTLAYVDFMLPEPARAELGTLFDAGRPMRAAAVAQVFLEEQGQLPRQLFADWSAQPFAAASIGQVHRARLADGRALAVKVQYPKIAEALQAELQSAKLLEQLGSLIFRGQERGVLVEELRERLSEECDYRIEARQQEEFRLRFLDTAGLRIPGVLGALTSRRILVSELIEGESFAAFLARAGQAERDRAALIIFRFYIESFCRYGVFNADPHPGNYLFADGRVVILDFGCVKRMAPEQVGWWRRFLRAYLERDFERARQLLIEMGMVPDPEGYDFDYHHRMVLTTYEFALHAERFRFDRDFMRRMLHARGRDNPGKFRVNVPKDWIFANRMVLGLFALMARLGAEVDFRGALLELLYGAGEARPEPYGSSELARFIDYRRQRPRGARRPG